MEHVGSPIGDDRRYNSPDGLQQGIIASRIGPASFRPGVQMAKFHAQDAACISSRRLFQPCSSLKYFFTDHGLGENASAFQVSSW